AGGLSHHPLFHRPAEPRRHAAVRNLSVAAGLNAAAVFPVNIAVLADAPEIGLPRVADEHAARQAGAELVLGYRDGRLSLWRPAGDETPLCVDFDSGALGYRLAAERVRHERLVRAVGKIQDNGEL